MGYSGCGEEEASSEDGLTASLRQATADCCAHKRTKHGALKARTQDIDAHSRKRFADWLDKPNHCDHAPHCEQAATGP